MKFIAADTETGGLDPLKHSLLTLCFRVLDENLDTIDQLSVAVKHEVYRVTAGAMRVNKIDLVKHDQIAVPVPAAQQMIENFVVAHGSTEKLIWMMHNVPFDKGFLGATFDLERLKAFIDYHSLDTVTLGVVEKWLGTLSKKQSLSLGKIADTLQLEKGPEHTAEGDVTTMVNYGKSFIARYKAFLLKASL